ncbi:MAG: glycosyl hydrolase family 18 protein, partial [Chlamydiales bacterium]
MSVEPVSKGYENSTWLEDWSQDLDNPQYLDKLLSQHVDTINIFVGQLDFDAQGNPMIDGFSEDTPGQPLGTGVFKNEAELVDFIKQCHAKGIHVKLSLGGQNGTTFGDSWTKLTNANVEGFAQALSSFCAKTGADGVDFDDELEDTGVAALAGKLAGDFKDLNPNLETSFCLYAGIGYG